MSDPHAVERKRWERETTQLNERIKLGLAPSDDDLPMAQAVRHKEEMEQASKAWRKRRGE